MSIVFQEGVGPQRLVVHRETLPRRRMMSGYELVRAMARGPLNDVYVTETEERFRVIYRDRCVGIIQRHPNGTYGCGHHAARDLGDLARRLARLPKS